MSLYSPGSYDRVKEETRQVFKEAGTMQGELTRKLWRFTWVKDIEKFRQKVESDKEMVVALHEKAEAIINKLQQLDLTDERIKDFRLEDLFAAWEEFDQRVVAVIGPDFDQVKEEIERKKRSIENRNKLAPGKRLVFMSDVEGLIPAGSIAQIEKYEPDDIDHPEQGGLLLIKKQGEEGVIEVEIEDILEWVESGEVKTIERPVPAPEKLNGVIDDMHDDHEEEGGPLGKKAESVLQSLSRNKKRIALLAGFFISVGGAVWSTNELIKSISDDKEISQVEPEQAESEIDVSHLIPRDTTDRQEMMLTRFFTKATEEGLDNILAHGTVMDSPDDFLVIKRLEGDQFTVEYRASEAEKSTTLTYSADSDDQISLVEVEAPKKITLEEILPSQLTEDERREVVGNFKLIEQEGVDSLELNIPQDIVVDLINVTRTKDNNFTLKYRSTKEGEFKQLDYSLEEDGWHLVEKEPSSEDRSELISRLRAEKGSAEPGIDETESTSPEPSPDPEASAPDPSSASETQPEPEEAESVLEHYSVKIDDGSQWRIIPGEGMSSLEWISPDGGDWGKPPHEVMPLGQTGIGIYDEATGTYPYVIKLDSSGNFTEIRYGDHGVDTDFDPASGGATGALFDARHAKPIAAVATTGDIGDLGAPPAPRRTPEITPGFEFAPEYLDDSVVMEELEGQLDMIEARIDALKDFRRFNNEQFTDRYQEKYQEDLVRLNRVRSEFLASVANGQAESFRFDAERTYQEEMNHLYHRYDVIHSYSPEQVRDLEEHEQLTLEFVKAQQVFIGSQNPEEAEQRLRVLTDLTQQANRLGHALRPFRRVSLFSRLDSSGPLSDIADKGIKQEHIDKLFRNLSIYNDSQLQELRQDIARVDETLRLFPEQPTPPKKKLKERIQSGLEDAFGYPELTTEELQELHADLSAGNGSQEDVREYHQELKTKSIDELQLMLDKSYDQLVTLIHQDLDNTSPQELFTLIERRASMHAAYNSLHHSLQPERTRGLDQTGTFDDRVFGPGGRGLELGLRDLESRHLQELSIQAFENSSDPEWRLIIKALKQEGEYPPRNSGRINRESR